VDGGNNSKLLGSVNSEGWRLLVLCLTFGWFCIRLWLDWIVNVLLGLGHLGKHHFVNHQEGGNKVKATKLNFILILIMFMINNE